MSSQKIVLMSLSSSLGISRRFASWRSSASLEPCLRFNRGLYRERNRVERLINQLLSVSADSYTL
jgi:hypothetical protein